MKLPKPTEIIRLFIMVLVAFTIPVSMYFLCGVRLPYYFWVSGIIPGYIIGWVDCLLSR
jgi:hypothetical protein